MFRVYMQVSSNSIEGSVKEKYILHIICACGSKFAGVEKGMVITMKLMFASDIHGSEYYCKKLIKAYEKENAKKLFLLGDLLYHGPRNALPEGYHPKGVISLLNEKKSELLCVRGNCEAEVDQMVLEFPVMADYAVIYLEEHMVFLTHGHLNVPSLKQGDILIHGHTHIQAMEDRGDYIYLNPGSVSIPKEGNENSYMIYEDGVFAIKNLEGSLIKQFYLKGRFK